MESICKTLYFSTKRASIRFRFDFLYNLYEKYKQYHRRKYWRKARMLIISEDPAIDFIVTKIIKKFKTIYYSRDRFMPGIVSNFKENVRKFFKRVRKVRKKGYRINYFTD